MKISAVDQSPIFSNSSADDAIKETRELAKYCDSLGLNRFWLAEHHGSNSFALHRVSGIDDEFAIIGD